MKFSAAFLLTFLSASALALPGGVENGHTSRNTVAKLPNPDDNNGSCHNNQQRAEMAARAADAVFNELDSAIQKRAPSVEAEALKAEVRRAAVEASALYARFAESVDALMI